jgi:hypothetical protein
MSEESRRKMNGVVTSRHSLSWERPVSIKRTNDRDGQVNILTPEAFESIVDLMKY